MTLSPTLSVSAQAAAHLHMEALRAIAASGPDYGRPRTPRTPRRVLLEYVSADPHGPLTAAHGRGAVLGDTLAALLAFGGDEVTREFYVNDATNGRQMRRFAHALLARYREALGLPAAPADAEGYPDAYVREVAGVVLARDGDRYAALPDDEARAALQQAAAGLLRDEQQAALARLGVTFDNHVRESTLHGAGAVGRVLDRLRSEGHAEERGGALWLRSTRFGDEADRTLVRADGTPTYLAGDLAYHADKFERGFDVLVDIWSADHAGYVGRTRAGLAALGYDPARLHVLVHGPVRVLKDGTEVRDDRAGSNSGGGGGGALNLGDVLEVVAPSALRGQYLRAPAARPLDLDADAAARDDRTNPLRYLHRALAHPGGLPPGPDLSERLAAYPEVVAAAADALAPDALLDYALTVADLWLAAGSGGDGDAPAPLRDAVRVVLTNSLRLLRLPVSE